MVPGHKPADSAQGAEGVRVLRPRQKMLREGSEGRMFKHILKRVIRFQGTVFHNVLHTPDAAAGRGNGRAGQKKPGKKGRGHQETPAAEKQGMKQAAGTGNAPRSSEKERGSGVQPPSGLNGPGSVFRHVRLSLLSGAETKKAPQRRVRASPERHLSEGDFSSRARSTRYRCPSCQGRR